MFKILLVGQSTKHFSYYESLVRELVARGHKIEFRYDPSFSENRIHSALQKFLNEYKTKFLWMPNDVSIIRYFRFFFRELRTYSWYLRRTDQAQYYVDRWAHYFFAIGRLLKHPLAKRHLSKRWFFELLASIERYMPAPRAIYKDLSEARPDLVLVSPGNMRFSREVDYIKVAKKKNILTVISVLSWDNLTNKGFFHLHPDYFLAWNKHHAEELIGLHCASPKSISVVGASLFDKWLTPTTYVEPSDNIKIITSEPYILYLGSSSNIAKDESGILKGIVSDARRGGESLRIIFKPHPGHHHCYNGLDIEGVEVLGAEYGLSETHQDVANMKWLVGNSRLVIGINTSGMIDSVILGKETYAYVSPEYSETQTSSAHYKVLSEYRVVHEVRTYEDLGLAIHYKKEFTTRRNAFIADFIRPVDLNQTAGQVAAGFIEYRLKSRRLQHELQS